MQLKCERIGGVAAVLEILLLVVAVFSWLEGAYASRVHVVVTEVQSDENVRPRLHHCYIDMPEIAEMPKLLPYPTMKFTAEMSASAKTPSQESEGESVLFRVPNPRGGYIELKVEVKRKELYDRLVAADIPKEVLDHVEFPAKVTIKDVHSSHVHVVITELDGSLDANGNPLRHYCDIQGTALALVPEITVFPPSVPGPTVKFTADMSSSATSQPELKGESKFKVPKEPPNPKGEYTEIGAVERKQLYNRLVEAGIPKEVVDHVGFLAEDIHEVYASRVHVVITELNGSLDENGNQRRHHCDIEVPELVEIASSVPGATLKFTADMSVHAKSPQDFKGKSVFGMPEDPRGEYVDIGAVEKEELYRRIVAARIPKEEEEEEKWSTVVNHVEFLAKDTIHKGAELYVLIHKIGRIGKAAHSIKIYIPELCDAIPSDINKPIVYLKIKTDKPPKRFGETVQFVVKRNMEQQQAATGDAAAAAAKVAETPTIPIGGVVRKIKLHRLIAEKIGWSEADSVVIPDSEIVVHDAMPR